MKTRRALQVQFTVTLKREQYQALKRLDADIGAGLTAHVRIAVNRYVISEWAKRRELERAATRAGAEKGGSPLLGLGELTF